MQCPSSSKSQLSRSAKHPPLPPVEAIINTTLEPITDIILESNSITFPSTKTTSKTILIPNQQTAPPPAIKPISSNSMLTPPSLDKSSLEMITEEKKTLLKKKRRLVKASSKAPPTEPPQTSSLELVHTTNTKSLQQTSPEPTLEKRKELKNQLPIHPLKNPVETQLPISNKQ